MLEYQHTRNTNEYSRRTTRIVVSHTKRNKPNQNSSNCADCCCNTSFEMENEPEWLQNVLSTPIRSQLMAETSYLVHSACIVLVSGWRIWDNTCQKHCMHGSQEKPPCLIMLAASSFLINIRESGTDFQKSEPDAASHTLAACLTKDGCFLCGGTWYLRLFHVHRGNLQSSFLLHWPIVFLKPLFGRVSMPEPLALRTLPRNTPIRRTLWVSLLMCTFLNSFVSLMLHVIGPHLVLLLVSCFPSFSVRFLNANSQRLKRCQPDLFLPSSHTPKINNSRNVFDATTLQLCFWVNTSELAHHLRYFLQRLLGSSAQCKF